MPTSEGPREFCAADAARDFALTLPGKYIIRVDDIMPPSAMKVTRVGFPSGELDAVYEVEGYVEGTDNRVVRVITADMRIRILEAGEVPASSE